ncbi:MAG: response regulator [Faecalibacterium sp.]
MNDKKTAGLRVALASYDARELRVQQRYLQEQCTTLICCGFQKGQTLLDALGKEDCFDVIVLGSELEDMDQLRFIQKLRDLEHRPLLLLFNEGRRRSHTARRLGLESDHVLHAGLEELMRELSRQPGCTGTAFDLQCRRLYMAWGIRQPDGNCGYFTAALRIACESERHLAIRKEILQRVSEEEHVTVSAVDSGIRRMVDELEAQQAPGWQVFKQKAHFTKKPSTGKLIYAAKEQLLRGMPQR